VARIRVSKGRFGVSFIDAVKKSNPGDVLMVSEGEHELDSVSVSSLEIVGVGDPDKIVLRGYFIVQGQCKISNVTIVAPPFHNAIYLPTAGAHVELEAVVLHGDPTVKYPVIYSSGSTVVIRRSTIHFPPSSSGIVIENDGLLHATDSQVAGVNIVGSRAVLINVSTSTVSCRQRGRVEAYGALTVSPAENQRSLVIEDESVCTVESLRATDGPWEALCDASVLRLDTVDVPAGQTYLVHKKGHALVETSSPAVTVIDPEAQLAPEPSPVTGSKVVQWHLADAHQFQTAVAPQLNVGDTVVLGEGEYFLEEYDHLLSIGVDFAGTGRAEKTIVNGGLAVREGCDVAISNLTLRPSIGSNAVMMQQGNSVSMTNVILESPAESEYPTVYIGSGRATMAGCTVVASAQSIHGAVQVDQGSHLEATDTWLGWLQIFAHSSADLSNCSSFQVWAVGNSKVTSTNGHFASANDCSHYQVGAQDGAVLLFDRITTDAEDFAGTIQASRLKIEWLDTPETGSASIVHRDDAMVSVKGPRVTITELDDLDGAPGEAPGAAPASVEPASMPAADARSSALPASAGQTAESGADGGADPLGEILALTGLTRVKEQIQTFTRMVQFNQLRVQRGHKSTDMTMHSLFLGNPGTGKTTVARLLGTALFDAGAIDRDVFVEVGRRDLVGQVLGASANMTLKVLESARGGVLFIDEAYALYQKNNNEFGQEAVDTLIAFMENNRDDIVIIFAGYTDQMQDFLNMNSGLQSRVPNRFDFEDYSPAEIVDIGYQSLLRDDYTVDADLYHRVVADTYRRSTDKSNGRWVRNFNQELVKQMARRVVNDPAQNFDDLAHITDEDIYNVAGGDSDRKDANVQLLLEQLDGLAGLTDVKEWVRKLVNRVKVDQQRREMDGNSSRPTYHMVFAGNPGTGKTTVAKIIAQLFYNLGILENATVKEVDRTKLVGQFIGHTEQNTSKAIDAAMGGVLFVDEAYQLQVEGMGNDFGQQAIETFMTRLENDRDKFVSIFAGYTENMDRFLGANPGLRSRIPLTIEFPDFSPIEVGQIVVARLSKSWTFDEELLADAAARTYATLEPQDRSNGRWARTFTERIEAEQIEYVAANGITGLEMKKIPAEVIEALTLG
jgi:SpoVK/Ycf46/Vps4 family AAA+-type ATPase